MKSKMKKILSFFMAAVMIFSICVPAFAASANSASQINVNVEVDKASYKNRERIAFNTYVENNSDEPKDVTVKILHTSFIHTNAKELNFKDVAPHKKAVTPFFATAYRTKLHEESYDRVFKLFGGDLSVLACRFIAFLAPNMECMVFEIEDSIGAVVYSYYEDKEPVPQPGTYLVKFDSNGGSAVKSQTVNENGLAVQPENPVKQGYRLVAWYKDAEFNEVYDFSKPVTENMTLYAKWELIAASEDTMLDKPVPDVEFYSFETNTWDILVGTPKTVTFTSEVFSEIPLGDKDIYVADDKNKNIGYMNDKGINGDAAADDGIYTLKVDLSSSKKEEIKYHAAYKDIKSEEHTIMFYKNITDEDLKALDSLEADLDKIAAAYLDEEGYLLEGKCDEAIAALKKALDTDERVEKYTVSNTVISIDLKNGTSVNYILAVKNMLSGIGAFSAYDPMPSVVKAAEKIFKNVDETTFDINALNENVTLDSLKKISNYDIILIATHGGFDSKFGSGILTGEVYKKEDCKSGGKYFEDYSSRRIAKAHAAFCKDTYYVGAEFFDKYLEKDSLKGAFIYLGACHSVEDALSESQHSLARTLVKKGALAVIGTDDQVHFAYEADFQEHFFNRLTSKNENQKYYTLKEALDYTREKIKGPAEVFSDGRFALIAENDKYDKAFEYSFNKKPTGEISGTVKSASDESPISNALVRVYDEYESEVCGSVRTSPSGNFIIKDLEEGTYTLKISKGLHKSYMVKVDIQPNRRTSMGEILLQRSVTGKNSAKGIIRNSLTNEPVSNVTINLRKSSGNKNGRIIKTTQTNNEGCYEFKDLEFGYYTIEYSKTGFAVGYLDISVTPTSNILPINAIISPVASSNIYRVVLTWKDEPHDLDSHLHGTLSDGSSFEVAYYNKQVSEGETVICNLDIDDTNGYGPETTTINTVSKGPYYYFVHKFSGYGTLSASNANVKLYCGDTLIRSFNAPVDQGSGIYWNIFAIKNGEIIVNDTITDTANLSYAE